MPLHIFHGGYLNCLSNISTMSVNLFVKIGKNDKYEDYRQSSRNRAYKKYPEISFRWNIKPLCYICFICKVLLDFMNK